MRCDQQEASLDYIQTVSIFTLIDEARVLATEANGHMVMGPVMASADDFIS